MQYSKEKYDEYRKIRALGGLGILEPHDLPSIHLGCLRALAVLADHRWHSGREIIDVVGQQEGLRRTRQLRKRFKIDCRRAAGTGALFEYRLGRKLSEEPTTTQAEMEF